MAPLEDLQARDLEWISDFVMQQMVIMLRPMMDHLQQTDAAVDYAQRVVQRLSMDVSELRGDIERTNKYLAILRQGLGMQNEGKCALQRSLEVTTRTVKRLDEQIEGILGVMRGVEDSIGQICSDARGSSSKQEDLAKQVAENTSALEQLQAKVEKVSSDAHSIKDDLLSSEARLEIWQRELRELRRNQLGIGPKLEEKAGRPPPSAQSGRGAAAETWSQKKVFAAVDVNGPGGALASVFGSGGGLADATVNSGSSQQGKRISRVSSASGRVLQAQLDRGGLSQELADSPAPQRSSSRAAVREHDASDDRLTLSVGEEGLPPQSPTASRLPLLPKQAGARPLPDRANGDVPRLRFAATLAKPSSRGSPS